ncbi:MAG: integration host factor subunit alpha [Deltaproteobacteria bacterium]|nr:MAG: integration host factor subunit alpha [Deltaproteobacteria bacterium]
MTKADLIERICERVGGFSKKEAAEVVEALFELMKSTLERGEKIKISGFGNFEVRDKKPRPGRNPKTHEPIIIEARRVLTFKPSNLLKGAMNRDRDRHRRALAERAAKVGILLDGVPEPGSAEGDGS